MISLALNGVAPAQESVVLEEVIVTAQKRAQPLQEVPLSVSVVSADEVIQAQISNIQDLRTRIPGVSISQFGGGANLSYLFVRGIGNNTATKTLRAASIIDDVPITDIFGLNNNLVDVQQIEVLRGPQSTLYGLTAEAGLIVVKTRRPGSEFRGEVAVQGVDIGDYSGTAKLDLPIVRDKLSLGLSAFYEDRDGFIRGQLLGDDYDKGKSNTLRGRLVWTPTDALDFDLSYAHDSTANEHGQAFLPVDRAAYVARHNNPVARATSAIPFTTLSPLGDFEIATDTRGFARITADNMSLRAGFKVPFGELVSVSAYREESVQQRFDVGVQPGAALGGVVQSGINPKGTTRSFYQELRLGSAQHERWSWTVGATYFERTAMSPAIQVGTTAFGDVNFGDGFSDDYESRALFGQVEFRPTEKIELLVGARYEDTDSTSLNLGGFVGFPAPDAFEAADNGLRTQTSTDEFLPKLTLSFVPNKDVRLYATVARGWLPGSADADPEPGESGVLDKETSTTFEIGGKTQLLGGRLRVNGAVFQTTIEDYQESTFVGPVNQILTNVDETRFRGFELEMAASLTDRLRLSGGYAYVDAEYTDFIENIAATPITPAAAISRNGNRIAGVPKSNFNLGLDLSLTDALYARVELTGAGSFLERSDRSGGRGTALGPVFIQPALGEFEGHEIVNLKLGYDSERWSALIFANNLLDERYFTLTTNTYALNGLGDVYLLGAPGRSRTIGARVAIKF
jgi:iron complex outermembrane recepter protein